MRNMDLANHLRGVAKKDTLNHQEKRTLQKAAERLNPYARLMELQDVEDREGTVWIEIRNSMMPEFLGLHEAMYVQKQDDGVTPNGMFIFAVRGYDMLFGVGRLMYNIDWRCWTARPTEEQRKEEWE